MPSVYVFDAYGTLFDVHSAVNKHATQVGADAARLSEIWRTKQLEYSWVRSLTGAYRPFWELTAEALDFAFAQVPSANKLLRDDLLNAYKTLSAYEDVMPMLTRLKEQGFKTAILSNGSPEMLDSAVNHAGLSGLLDEVLSVDTLQQFKTSPAVYAMVTGTFGVAAADVSFQSSNRWDIAGATHFGFQTFWINRTNQPDEYPDLPATQMLQSLSSLPIED